MKNPTRRTFFKGGAALGVATLAGCAAPGIEARDEETRLVAPTAYDSVEISNVNGSVSVEPWDQADVEVRIVKRGFFTEDVDSVQVDIAGDETLQIARIVRDEDPTRVIVNIEVRVPPEFPVVRASTSNGSVSVRGTVGDLVARATNGSIDVRRIDGFTDLTTSNGSISAFDVAGLDGVRTTNGSIDVDVVGIRGDTNVETSNGSIQAALARDLNVELVAQTSTGSVDASDISLSNADASRNRVSGTLGEGGPRLNVLTSNGSIELSLL